MIHAAHDQSLLEVLASASPGAVAESAMETVARRYTGLVYHTAKRLVGDPHLAEDVTQATFIVLARKADTLDARYLPGWLVNTAKLCSKEALRSRSKRTLHESRAAVLRAESAPAVEDPTVPQLIPLLDMALSKLGEPDRTAVVARFFLGRSFADVGASMGISEEAARKRVARAVNKMRATFLKQGLLTDAGAIMIAMASEQVRALPPYVARAVAGTAVYHGLSFGGKIAHTVATSTTSIAAKTVVLTTGAALLIAAATAATLLVARMPNNPPRALPPAGQVIAAEMMSLTPHNAEAARPVPLAPGEAR